jgi:signal transduction histidine kinase/DNA-binding response OmpR family regulator
VQKAGFVNPVRSKIIIASILACAALFTAWKTSKNAFMIVLNSFQKVSAPNDKLRQVDELSYMVMQLDQEQRANILAHHYKSAAHITETRKISERIDTLTRLYANAPKQVKRLKTLKSLLQERGRLYTDYADVREGLINNKAFTQQLSELNDIVNKSAAQTDSMVTSTERKISTTVTPAVHKKHVGFLKKLFGRQDTDTTHNYKVVEEVHVRQDTLTSGLKDSLIQGVGRTMQDMAKTQQVKSQAFIRREALLGRANANVTRQMLAILKKVEADAIAQAAGEDAHARDAVKRGIERISLIMILFAWLTALLVYFILRDISRINKYRRELEAAKDEAEHYALAKHRFLSNMSHELRTPLQSILGFTEIIRHAPKPQKNDIETIYRSANHLLQIVNEVLDYNRIISGKFTFVNEPFDLPQLLEDVLLVMRPQAEKKGLMLVSEIDAEDGIGELSGDAFRLKQVLYNLIGNAIKFTDEGSVLLKTTIQNLKKQVICRFEVTDTGVGLSETEIDHIFNEFEQAGNEKRVRSGTGLGLAIAKALIESQEGHITVKSEPGKGSTFTFELRFRKAENVVADTSEINIVQTANTAGKVWVIDDDTFILEFCARIFDQHKVAYHCFSSASAMLDTDWDNEVTCILIDMRMPGMDGAELCRLMRRKAPVGTPIYALTAQVMQDEISSITEYGFNGLLMKPFSGSELVNIIGGTQAQKTAVMNPLLDMDVLEKMTLGNTGQILLHFAEDTLQDIAHLKPAMNKQQIDNILLLIHRIAGRTAQVGAGELSKNFRLAEMQLRKSNYLSAEWMEKLNEHVEELQDLALSVKDMAENETEV